MDGTLVDSTQVVERHWRLFGTGTASTPGRSSRPGTAAAPPTCWRSWRPQLDAAAEAAAIDAGEEADHHGLVAVPGAAELLAALPAAAWAVVTSAHRSLAVSRLTAVGLPVPAAMVCGDEVRAASPIRRATCAPPGCSGWIPPTASCSRTSRPGSPRAGRPVRSWWPSRRRSRSRARRGRRGGGRPARRRRGARAARVGAPFRLTAEPGYVGADAPDRPRSSPCSRWPPRPPWHPPRPTLVSPVGGAQGRLVPGAEVAAAVGRGERGGLHRAQVGACRRRASSRTENLEEHGADDGADHEPPHDERSLLRHALLAGGHAQPPTSNSGSRRSAGSASPRQRPARRSARLRLTPGATAGTRRHPGAAEDGRAGGSLRSPCRCMQGGQRRAVLGAEARR